MEKNRFFGVGEPLIQRQRDQGIDAAAYLALVAGLGCTAFRSWMHITEILDDPSTPNPEAVAMHTKLLNQAAELDIEVHRHEPRVVPARGLQAVRGLLRPVHRTGGGLPAPGAGTGHPADDRKHRRLRRHRAQTHGREMT